MIVDQNGKPFNPSPMQQILSHAAANIALQERPNKLLELSRIAELRKSCGEGNGTITLRRYLPFSLPKPATDI